ncbi:MAG: sulfite exporter TauE/SafE family protein [Anaerolineae bacterium]|nr:sulfite exporter TauE/SafE family protein [Anaerolineae bacterium]
MESNQKTSKNHEKVVAFLLSIPIGFVGGLIGLGGAEFRLPVLIGLLGRQARQAISINLAVSLITILSSSLIRLRVFSEFPFTKLLPVLLSMILGAVLSAFIAAGAASKISSHVLEAWMKFLLVSIGLLLVVEGFFPIPAANLLFASPLIQFLVGITAGILIGIVSSTLGVAGGELIIPTLIFVFGIGVKLAGTASLLISLPTVITGLIRYYRLAAFFDRSAMTQIVIPMGVGSIIGSILGGLLFGIASQNGLKALLGLILIYSAIRMFLRRPQPVASSST